MKTIATAAFAAAAIGLAGIAGAQQPAAPPARDFSKTVIKTTDLGDNTYMLEGQGGNITVAVGGDGVIMVDWRVRAAARQDQGRHRRDHQASRSSFSSTPISMATIPAATRRSHKDGAIVVAQVNVK